MDKINYVIGAYFGPRRHDDWKSQDTSCFLKKSLEVLDKTKHNLAQITIVINHYDGETPETQEYINDLSTIGGTPVKVLRRENEGISYGGYNHAFETYRDQFDYYIFCEDDYVFVKDCFDKILVDMFNEKKCGYLCGYANNLKGIVRGSISNGITSIEILEKAYAEFGMLPWKEGQWRIAKRQAQLDFTRSFMQDGKEIVDWTDEYRSSFFDCRFIGDNKDEQPFKGKHPFGTVNNKGIVEITMIPDEYLSMPYQMLD